ncbi:uncharacterized protein LOC117135095 [Drosophila busckii]|uniref:uncharacterized protein LOC117135095 n=1 Tax=Drosophila busckii TaxID=30019 RepID=UPI001432FE0F|nr:uncharacterized protein LOC117135095 [Drosophila busckii]
MKKNKQWCKSNPRKCSKFYKDDNIITWILYSFGIGFCLITTIIIIVIWVSQLTTDMNEANYLNTFESTVSLEKRKYFKSIMDTFRFETTIIRNFNENELAIIDSTSSSSYWPYERSNMYEFALDVHKNFSVHITIIEGYNESMKLNILWFPGQVEKNTSYLSQTAYNCQQYLKPYIAIDNLKPNLTYTICIMPIEYVVTSPQNCKPLHIATNYVFDDMDSIWISDNEKELAVVVLCFVFCLSVSTGAFVAYFWIKSNPQLLKRSKIIMDIKNMDKACYVSTIKLSVDSKDINMQTHDDYFINKRKRSTEFLSFSSTSTYFEEFCQNFDHQVYYELPLQQDIVKNGNYYKNSDIPPPLPKRNSIETI